MNGMQVEHVGPVTRCAVAVDASSTHDRGRDRAAAPICSSFTTDSSGEALQPIRGHVYERVRRLIAHDVARVRVAPAARSSSDVGNNALLARELGLTPDSGFARFESIEVGVMGTCDVATAVLVERCEQLARREGGQLVTVGATPGRRTTTLGDLHGRRRIERDAARGERPRTSIRSSWARVRTTLRSRRRSSASPCCTSATMPPRPSACARWARRSSERSAFRGASSPLRRVSDAPDDRAALARRSARVGAPWHRQALSARRSGTRRPRRWRFAPGPCTHCSARTARASRR